MRDFRNGMLTNNTIKSIYPYNELTIQQLLSRFYSEIKNTTEISNKALKFLDWLVEVGVKEETIAELQRMYEDGELDQLVNVEKYNELVKNVSGQLEQINDVKINKDDTISRLLLKRDKTTKIELEDLSQNVIGSISGNSTFNLLSIPQDDSVVEEKLSPTIIDFLYKENLFSSDSTKWQWGNSDTPPTSITSRITTPPKDRIETRGMTSIVLFFTNTNIKIGVKQFDSAGTQLNDSGWKNANTVNQITLLSNAIKFGFTVAYVGDTTIDVNAIQNIEVTCNYGTRIQKFKKSNYDKKIEERNEILSNIKYNTINNLLDLTLNNWLSATLDGNKTTPIYNTLVTNTLRISMDATKKGIDTTRFKTLYFKNIGNIYDFAIKEVDVNRMVVKDSGWFGTDVEYKVMSETVEVYFTMKCKTNIRLTPQAPSVSDIYLGYIPYDISYMKTKNSEINKMFIPSKVRYVAHRGLSGFAPENTLASFNIAGERGCWGIEADLSVTKDNEFVIMHDLTVDRTTNGSGNVNNFTLEEIKSLNIDYGNYLAEYPNEKVPTFQEYLNVCRKYGSVPILELKDGTLTETLMDKLITVIQESGFEETCIIISYNINYLSYIRRKNKKIHIQPLIDLNGDFNNILIAKSFGNSSINSGNTSTIKDNIKIAHKNGLMVNVNTINNETVRDELISYGIDMITSDVFY